jgi:uncharacterized protein YkwD
MTNHRSTAGQSRHRRRILYLLCLCLGWLGCGEPDQGTVGLSPDTHQDDGVSTHEIDEALVLVNAIREPLTGSVLIWSDPLTEAAQNHADYLVLNGLTGSHQMVQHREEPGLPAFTGETIQERLKSVGFDGIAVGENIAIRPTVEAALQSWLESLYSRIALIRPEATHLGLGEASAGANRLVVMVIGSHKATRKKDAGAPVMMPPEGQEQVSLQWDGNEVPQPTGPPEGYPSGPMISLHFAAGRVEVQSALLEDTLHEVPRGAAVLTAAKDPFLEERDVALLPYQPLAPNRTYRVTIHVEHEGSPSTQVWQFTTRPDPCDAVEQNCGYGRGCYIQGGQPTCLWVGPQSIGSACAYMNDCTRGSGCYQLDGENQCRRYCGRQGQDACATVCPIGSSLLNDELDIGFCR